MKNINKLLVAGLAGLVVGAAVATLFATKTSETSGESVADEDEQQVLYWAAPMDANYQRDKPGLSPMGMQLIPVYQDEQGASLDGPGTVSISPNVVNNLGVRTAKAKKQSMYTTITTVGYVGYNQDKLVHIHPRVEGWVDKLYLKSAGDPVRKGQPLYDLYSPQLVNAQEELLLAMNRSANKQGPNRLIEAAKDRLKALQIDDDFIAQLMHKKQVKQTVRFYSPQSGVVDNLNIREGFFVGPGTTLMSIGALDEVWVEAEVFERQASLVEIGLPVTMTLDYLPGERWEGKVDYVYPTLDAKTRTARLRLKFANSNRTLKPNMYAQVEIHAHSADDVLVIPREALIRTGTQNRVVLAMGNGQFKSIAIGLGRLDGKFAEIKSGLSAGEAVVTSAQFLLDSESSKTSDFTRMHHQNDETLESGHASMEHELDKLQPKQPQPKQPQLIDHSKMDHGQSGEAK
ncbi:MAG: Cu(I)/Ag(I) efflux system membrane fusion protein [Lentisphaeria bacterium]|jgi:Cu(I)/Ag(I) efflux system membrane fusion protein